MVTSNTLLQEAKCSQVGPTIWGQQIEALMGTPAQSAHLVRIFTTWPVHQPARPLRCNTIGALCSVIAVKTCVTIQMLLTTQKGRKGAAPKGNSCFEVVSTRAISRDDCPKLNNKDGVNGNAQGFVVGDRGLARSSSGSTSGILNRLNSRSRPRSSSTVSIGSIRNEGIIGTITRAFRQRIHKA
ncbi:hypothetical protein Tco_0811247 [Tanacetum coccineum]